MSNTKRSLAYWVILCFLFLFLVLMLIGQTMAIVNYDFAVQLGLQESQDEVGEFGVQLNRAFGAADTLVYVPLIIVSIIGLILKKQWSLYTTAAVMGISVYWATTISFMLVFFKGVPDYNLEAGIEYWIFMGLFILFGVIGLLYLVSRGESLIKTHN